MVVIVMSLEHILLSFPPCILSLFHNYLMCHNNSHATSKLCSLQENDEQYTGDGSVDLKGHPVLKSRTGNWRACPFILGIWRLFALYLSFSKWGMWVVISNEI